MVRWQNHPDTRLAYTAARWELKVAWRQGIIVRSEPAWAAVDYQFKKAITRRLAHEIINDVVEAHFNSWRDRGGANPKPKTTAKAR